MSDNKKFVIENADLRVIRERGIEAFHSRSEFDGVQGAELSTMLVLMGVESFLKTKGIELPFELKINLKPRRY